MFTAALFTTDKIWKQPKSPSTDEWIKKMWGVCVCLCTHTHNKYYSAMRKNEVLLFVITRTNRKGIMLSKPSQTEKEKYHMISLIFGT